MGTQVTWCERAVDDARAAAFAACGVDPLVARLLAARGVGAEELDAFFDPAMARLIDPSSLPGVDRAVQVILPFLREKKKIVVFGDYDADGICASAVLVTTLRRLLAGAGEADAAACISAFVPRRSGEGYGMTAESLTRLRREHADVELVITVDNGISSPDEVAALRADGIAVVVTDHHLPGDRLPEADALVDPRVASVSGCDDLCGAGVAFYLAMALAKEAAAQGLYSGAKFGGPLLVLAGLATVADLMPLVGQNRILVTQSLAMFRHFAPLGLRELYLRAARNAAPLAARDYGFILAPRINAAGRMDQAEAAYDLIMCDDRERVRTLAQTVDDFNVRRKSIEQRMYQEACRQVCDGDDRAAIVVWGETGSDPENDADGWKHGVAGVVASRLLETYRVPVAVVVGSTGSARAPDGYNLHEALAASQDHLDRFGGHAAAGGFTVKGGGDPGLHAFRQAFTRACAEQRLQAPDATAEVFDAWIEPKDITLELYEALQRLEPFGEGNPEPVFGLRNVAFTDVKPIGMGRHAVFTFADRAIPRAVWWGHGADVEALRGKMSARFDVLFALMGSTYAGEPLHVELRLVALRPAAV